MLQKVSVGRKDLNLYRGVVGDELIDEIIDLAKELKGYRFAHINSTPFGGGVAEILASFIPLLQSVGVDIEWRVIFGDRQFFDITKGFHNGLQGADFSLTKQVQERYMGNLLFNARQLPHHYDLITINDPQPAALPYFIPHSKTKWVWRCHIDMAKPNRQVWDFLRPFIEHYHLAIFTMSAFEPPDLDVAIDIITPAIDILSTKNMGMPLDFAKKVIANQGVDIHKPLLLQVSRFDPWKDPMGVVKTYQLIKQEYKGIQLAFVGSMSQDDPQGWQMFADISEASLKDPSIYIFTNVTGVGNLEVNAFQRASTIILQKSIKEGFGLVVSEALWKQTPVVAGKAGGIVLQMHHELGDYLTETIEETAKKVCHLLKNPGLAQELGAIGKKQVMEHFLMPRMIKQELEAYITLLQRSR
ncbi:MAG: glycosyltransferase [Actinobacteria bacterium]|nr:MAG: glycosyltransferase [Actinomycetota bacterium]